MVTLRDVSEPIHTSAHPNSPSPIINEQACKKSPWSKRGYQEQIYLSPLCSVACDFHGPMQECVYMDAVETLPVWYGSPIMEVSFTTQPCKTKLHEIDYAHTCTSFMTIFSPSLPMSPALDWALFILTQLENKCPKDARIWSNGVLNYLCNNSNGGRNADLFIFCWNVRNARNILSNYIWKKRERWEENRKNFIANKYSPHPKLYCCH